MRGVLPYPSPALGYIGSASLDPDDQSILLQAVQRIAHRLAGISKFFWRICSDGNLSIFWSTRW